MSDGLDESFNAPFGCVIHAEGWERKLTSGGGHLENTAASLSFEMQQSCTNHLDGANKIGIDLMPDLIVGNLFSGSEEPVPCIVHNDIDLSEVSKSRVHDFANSRRIRQVEVGKPELFAVF